MTFVGAASACRCRGVIAERLGLEARRTYAQYPKTHQLVTTNLDFRLAGVSGLR
jgi:hypothetical protein